MKKYIQPSVKSIRFELSQMIATSIGIDNNTPINPADALGKKNNIFGDETEEW